MGALTTRKNFKFDKEIIDKVGNIFAREKS